MTDSYYNDILVKRPAIGLFETFDLVAVNCCHESCGKALAPARLPERGGQGRSVYGRAKVI